jgi:hypothetical protein
MSDCQKNENRDIEQTIREINGTMAIEGMPLTEDDKTSLRSVRQGEVTHQGLIQRLVVKYQTKNKP